MEGWIKLYRSIQKSDMYKSLNSKQRDIMVQCLLLANHHNNEWIFDGRLFKCSPGQFITSLKSLKEYCAKDVSNRNIRTALLLLEKWQFLTNRSTMTGRLITITKWDIYQGKNEFSDKGVDKEMTKTRHITKRNKNFNNEKNISPPTLELVVKYCSERKNSVDPETFWNFYNSKDWKVGKERMKDWHSAVHTWEQRDKKRQTELPRGTHPGQILNIGKVKPNF